MSCHSYFAPRDQTCTDASVREGLNAVKIGLEHAAYEVDSAVGNARYKARRGLAGYLNHKNVRYLDKKAKTPTWEMKKAETERTHAEKFEKSSKSNLAAASHALDGVSREIEATTKRLDAAKGNSPETIKETLMLKHQTKVKKSTEAKISEYTNNVKQAETELQAAIKAHGDATKKRDAQFGIVDPSQRVTGAYFAPASAEQLSSGARGKGHTERPQPLYHAAPDPDRRFISEFKSCMEAEFKRIEMGTKIECGQGRSFYYRMRTSRDQGYLQSPFVVSIETIVGLDAETLARMCQMLLSFRIGQIEICLTYKTPSGLDGDQLASDIESMLDHVDYLFCSVAYDARTGQVSVTRVGYAMEQ